MTARATVLGLAGAFAVTAPAHAGPKPVDLSGRWTFETLRFESRDCAMNGDLAVERAKRAGRYHAVMTTEEICTGSDTVIRTKQNSALTQINNAVWIKSDVTEVDPPVPYHPDHFEVRLIDPDTMRGRLKTNVEAPVEFRRVREKSS